LQIVSKSTLNLVFSITGPFVIVTTGSGVACATVRCAGGGVTGGGVTRVVVGDGGVGRVTGGGVTRVAGDGVALNSVASVGVGRVVGGVVVGALVGGGVLVGCVAGRGLGGGNLLCSTISFVLNSLGRITIFGACRRGRSLWVCWPCGSCHSQISNTARPASAKNRKPTSSIITQSDMNLFVLL